MEHELSEYWIFFKRFIRKKILLFLNRPLYNDQQLAIFNEAKVGDIIFCEMPFNDRLLFKIKKGHRNRPYIIVKKEKTFLWVYACTTHPNKRLSRIKKCKILYKNRKMDSYVILNEIFKMPLEKIISPYDRLDKSSMMALNRYIVMNKNHKHHGKLLTFGQDLIMQKGDIISHLQKYWLVYYENNEGVYVYPLSHEKKDGFTLFNFESTFRYIDLRQKYFLKGSFHQKLYSFFNTLELKEIDEKISSWRHKKKANRQQLIKKEIAYQFNYPCGSIFYDPWQERHLIYLFSSNGNSYISELETCEEGIFKLNKIDLDHFQIVDVLTDRSLRELVIELAKRYDHFAMIFEAIKNLKANWNTKKWL